MVTIPGLQLAGAPNYDQRVEVTYGNTVTMPLVTMNEGTHTPSYQVYVIKQHGSTVKALLEESTNKYIFETPTGDGKKEIKLQMSSDQLRIFPGTYVVRVFSNGSRVLERYLTVLDPIGKATSLPSSGGSAAGGQVQTPGWNPATQQFETTNDPYNTQLDCGFF